MDDNSNDSNLNQLLNFQVNDLEFCTTCGTILPLLTNENYLTCRLCKKTIQINRNNLFFKNKIYKFVLILLSR